MTKVNVISGFLGAGKTTLISKLLKEVFANQKVVLVENEFGEIGIDGGFLKDAGIEITEINSGCICCTLKGDFKTALDEVIHKYHPDRVIIEPSGVGKLSDILDIVESVDGVELESYSTIVDAKRCKTYHKNFKEFFDDQIEHAACVILSRTQMVDEKKLEEDLTIIKELNDDARIITTPWDQLSGKAIFDGMTGALDEIFAHEEHHHHEHEHEHDHECDCHDHENECDCHDHDHEHHHDHDEECSCGHHHDHDHDHEECSCGHHHDHDHHHHHDGECSCHEHHHADEVFTSIGLETIHKYSKDELLGMLNQLDEDIVRAKGIVPSVDGSWLFFDYVPEDAEVREGSPAYTGLITVIGKQVDEDKMKELFKVL